MEFKAKKQDDRNYLKLKAGESVSGVFRGNPFEFRVHWSDNRSSICPGDGCPLCAEGKKSKFAFRINFIVRDAETGHYVAKIWEQGWNTYEDLAALNTEYNPIEKHVIKITRQGEKLQTKYSMFPQNGVIDAEKEKLISAVPLNDLGHMTPAETEREPVDSADIPF